MQNPKSSHEKKKYAALEVRGVFEEMNRTDREVFKASSSKIIILFYSIFIVPRLSFDIIHALHLSDSCRVVEKRIVALRPAYATDLILGCTESTSLKFTTFFGSEQIYQNVISFWQW